MTSSLSIKDLIQTLVRSVSAMVIRADDNTGNDTDEDEPSYTDVFDSPDSDHRFTSEIVQSYTLNSTECSACDDELYEELTENIPYIPRYTVMRNNANLEYIDNRDGTVMIHVIESA